MNRFWRALESPTGLEQTYKIWREDLGSAFEATSGFLRPTARTAGAYPCPSPGGEGCPRRVVVHDDGEIVAVCNDSPQRCDRVELSRAEIVIHEVNVPRLCAEIAAALGLEASQEPAAPLDRTWSIGAFVPRAGAQLPVYLALPSSRGDFRRIVMELIVGGPKPLLILTPTSHRPETETLDLIRKNGREYLALSEILHLGQGGRLIATAALADLVGSQLVQSVDAPENSFVKRGDFWEIEYQGQSTKLKDQRGLNYIAYLLDRPGEEVHCVALYQAVNQNVAPVVLDSGSELLDRDSVTKYREQLRSSEAELEEARAHHDLGRQERLEDGIEHLKAEIGRAVGLHGVLRTEPGHLKRVRQAVGTAIRRTRKAIKKDHPELAGHLDRAIHLGSYVSYSPSQHISWHTG